jgi:hypothetical protein
MQATQDWVNRYDKMRADIGRVVEANEVRGKGRGVRRRAWAFTTKRLAAIQNRTSLEHTLERTIVWLLRDQVNGSAWFNQFNPASGAGGSGRENVDLLRWQQAEDRAVAHFLELKEWNSPDTICRMVEELIRYAMLTTILHDLRVVPYNQWPLKLDVHLWCIAPHQFFAERGGIDTVNGELSQLRDQWNLVRAQRPVLGRVTLEPRVISLSQDISRQSFCECFDPVTLEDAIQNRRRLASPQCLLNEDNTAALRNWITGAIQEGGLL